MKAAGPNLLTKALDAGGLAATRVVSQGLQFLLFLFAARFLTTADFGVFSLTFAMTLGLTVLAEAGWREYAVCSESMDSSAALNSTALLAGIAIALLLLAGCVAALALGLDRDYAVLAAVLAIWVCLRPLSTVQTGVMMRQGKLRQLIVIQLLSEAAGFVAGASAFVLGMGVLSLAIGKAALIILELAGGVLCVRNFRFRRPTKPELDEIREFSQPILGARLLQYIQTNYSTLAIGLLFSPAIVGIYRAAIRLVGTTQEVIREPARYVGWSSLRAARDKRREDFDPFPAAVTGLFEAVITLGLPVIVLLAVSAHAVVELLLGPKWAEVGSLLSILAIASAVRLVTFPVEPVLSLQGHPHLVQRNATLIFVLNLICFAVAVPFGIHAIAWADLAAALVTAPVALHLMHSKGGVSIAPLLRALLPSVTGCVVSAACVFLFRAEFHYSAWPLLLQLLSTAAIVGAAQALVVAGFWLIRRRGGLSGSLQGFRTAPRSS